MLATGDPAVALIPTVIKPHSRAQGWEGILPPELGWSGVHLELRPEGSLGQEGYRERNSKAKAPRREQGWGFWLMWPGAWAQKGDEFSREEFWGGSGNREAVVPRSM